MRLFHLVVFVISGMLLISSCKTSVISQTAAPKKWTVMLYLNGDDPVLESDFVNAFDSMAKAKVGTSDQVNIIIQFDRIPGHDISYGDWPITNRYFLQPGMLPTMDNAVADWGDGKGGREIKMDEPESLTGFIQWGKANYPAEKYVLIVADHGFAWQGLSIDATSDDNYMFLPELKKAIVDGGVQFDVLGLDACLMQTIEVAYELKPCGAKVMVGSQNPGTTWPFWVFLPNILQNPEITATEFGKSIVDTYSEEHSDDQSATLAVLDFDKFDQLHKSFDSFFESMIDTSSLPIIQEHAKEVMNKIEETIVYSKNHGQWDSLANGLSIYFPVKKGLYRPEFFTYYYIGKMTAFAEDCAWRDFLDSFYDPMSAKLHIPRVIYNVRPTMQTFVASDNIDLYDFCKRIANSQ